MDEIIIIDDRVLQTINVRPGVRHVILFFARGSRACACVRAAQKKKKNNSRGSRSFDFILNVMTLPQAFKRHSDRARVYSFLLLQEEAEGKSGGEREKDGNALRAVTSAPESPMSTGEGAESRRTSY